ncbi:Non-homologous end joining protein Ku OS=Streptomyces griseorubiginosus OX=67304 GN=ku PE=3 SV=1 [Streptomyces griseorubiginosus]
MVRGDVLVLHAMRWPDEVRSPAELFPPAVELDEDEIEGALALMDSMTRDDLDGDDLRDTYTEALAKVIEAKREDKPLPAEPEQEAPQGQVLDLMAALQESVQKAKASRGEDAEVHELPKKTNAKKTAKKQPAKKTAAKKTTAKKTTGRRPRSA